MKSAEDIPRAEAERLADKLRREAEAGGYHLNPDPAFTLALARGLLVNEGRYGYPSCPCRLASGNRDEDLDIVCPCDYRDADVNEFGACYCALYVNAEIAAGRGSAAPVPERRPPMEERRPTAAPAAPGPGRRTTYPVWRCRVCGYLCARDGPPDPCPVCKARRDRFEPFPL